MKINFEHTTYAGVSSLLGALVVGAILAGCTSQAAENKTETKAATLPAPVGTPVDAVVVQPGVVNEELEVTGTLIANQQVDLVSELTRRLVRVNVKEGSFVKQGALLFQLDDADLQAQLERLRQQEKLAVLNEKRLKDLIDHDAVIQQDYDEALTNLRVLEAQITELQVAIAKTRIQAPFDGQIGMINVHPGAVVSVNTLLTNIEDNSVVKVEFSVPEKYSHIITPGSEQSFTIASDDKRYKARVVARESSLDEDTRTLRVRAVAANPGHVLLPGQSARITLSLNTSGAALAVSSQALLPSSQGYNLYVSRHNTVAIVPVQIGQRSAASVEILSGLHQGDTVIVSNLLRLAPGVPVHFVTLK
ncbi:efflux RND transporter periplasmic adaptor subunit [Chryseolinea lacunae]|uniref:Efflux RND transporter periplasmic adaptor subunit n=1 Tax=Chryseolinea lacunae TaxID=2801331 RepID=A0ABS1L2W6_9BACT|nr:efflux RND transporter periplasmic adaptor subunit [Chryseolinea lacunae]MBL0745282.1 efflux RND transporter periplasmic adaptor subunit [Chryseolinea lacunae]